MSQPSVWMILTTSALLIGPANGFAASAKDYDIWQVASSGGTPYSAIHTRRTRAADGSEYLRQESRVLIDVLGQRQEMSDSTECRSTVEFYPMSYRYQQRSMSGDSTGEGRVEGNEFVLVLRRREMTLERRASLSDKLVFGEQLTDFLATKSDVSGPIKLAVLQGSSCIVKRANATRHPETNGRTRWTLEYEDGVGNHTVTLKADGTTERVEIARPNRVIALSSAEAAGKIRHLTYSNREMLTYTMTEPLPFPERAKAITMKLSWRNIPLEQLSLEDARQKLAKHEVDQDRHVAEVRLAQPAAVTQPAKLPITNPDLAPFLSEETFIRPRHPAICQKAAEWTAGATDALDAVNKLTHHVSQYLTEGVMIAETLSGPEVLECRKGKCAEFTTLLASLGRAAGIPTRVALGMRLVAGSWVGIAKLISLFCDGHASVVPNIMYFLPPGWTPYAAGSYQGRIFLCAPDGKGFLDPEHPYVTAIDGKPIADWLRVAGSSEHHPNWDAHWRRRWLDGRIHSAKLEATSRTLPVS